MSGLCFISSNSQLQNSQNLYYYYFLCRVPLSTLQPAVCEREMWSVLDLDALLDRRDFVILVGLWGN